MTEATKLKISLAKRGKPSNSPTKFKKGDIRLLGNKHALGVKPNQTSFKKGEHRSVVTEIKKGEHLNPDGEFKRGQFGKKSLSWKGGIHKRKDGYVRITVEGKRFLHHRHLLKGKITDGQVVHHIDRNPSNNSLDNLVVFPNNAEHMRHHARERLLKQHA